jgi:hypothetical protein
VRRSRTREQGAGLHPPRPRTRLWPAFPIPAAANSARIARGKSRLRSEAVLPDNRKLPAGTILVVAVLIGLLGFAIYIAMSGWGSGDVTDVPMSSTGWIAMVLGILATLALGIGLMALMYYSSRNNRD